MPLHTPRNIMDEDAVGSPLAFIVAGVIFLAVVGLLLAVAFNAAPSAESSEFDAGHQQEASATFARFIRSTGKMAYTDSLNGGWSTAQMDFPGLLSSDSLLDLAKLRHLGYVGSRPNWLLNADVTQTKLDHGTARARLGLDVLDLEFRVEFTAIGANCATAVFGAALPTNTPLEPASGTFKLTGPAEICVTGTPRPNLVEVRLYVFR